MIFKRKMRQDSPERGQAAARQVPDDLQRKRADADSLWSRGNNNRLRWPYNSMMVSEADKVLYVPIAKCACTSIKSMMVRLADIPHAERAIDMGVHWATDHFNTGVQLKDKPIAQAEEIIASDQYLKFAVIRNPVDRVLSAYLEKFVFRRQGVGNLRHTIPVIAAVQQTQDIDVQRGISFREFVDYLLSQDPGSVDPHWRPQYFYLQGVQHLNELYRLDAVEALTGRLQEYLGRPVVLGHQNQVRKSSKWLENAGELTSDAIEVQGSIQPESLLDDQSTAAIRSFYADDFVLYERAVG